jgi:hypothetical protein
LQGALANADRIEYTWEGQQQSSEAHADLALLLLHAATARSERLLHGQSAGGSPVHSPAKAGKEDGM